MDSLTKHQAYLDVAVVGGCSVAYIIASLLWVPIGWIIAAVAIVLGCYAWFALYRRSQSWSDYGIRIDNLAAAGWRVGAWTLVTGGLLVGWAVAAGHSLIRPELWILVPIYPLWGIIQQFIFQGILHRALLALVIDRRAALGINSMAFAMVHIADWRIALLTLFAGTFWSWFYQRWPNIWVLGLSHGVLAGLTYPLLLTVNPLNRIW